MLKKETPPAIRTGGGRGGETGC